MLSRNAGAYGRLGRYALPVNPFDVDEMAEALEQAISMPVDERTSLLARTVSARAGEPSGTVGPGSARGPRAREAEAALERSQEVDESRRPLDDDVGRVDQRPRRLAAPDGDTDDLHTRRRQPIERPERVEVGVIVPRVEDGLEFVLAHDALERFPFIGRPRGTSSITILPSMTSRPDSLATGCRATISAALAASVSGGLPVVDRDRAPLSSIHASGTRAAAVSTSGTTAVSSSGVSFLEPVQPDVHDVRQVEERRHLLPNAAR